MKTFRKAALLLTGVGRADGSETLEVASMIFALHKHNIKISAFSFDRLMKDNINHLTYEDEEERRNAMVESSRIMRGGVSEMETLSSSDFDFLLIPGGFGVPKNFCDFAEKGKEMTVDPMIQKIILDFHATGKPIGACCIAPILLAKVIENPTITLGKKNHPEFPYSGTVDAAEYFGANCEMKDAGEITVDWKNKLVTTPAFMKDSKDSYPVLLGNEALVECLLEF